VISFFFCLVQLFILGGVYYSLFTSCSSLNFIIASLFVLSCVFVGCGCVFLLDALFLSGVILIFLALDVIYCNPLCIGVRLVGLSLIRSHQFQKTFL